MAASLNPEVVLNPVPISFAPPNTEGVPIGTPNQALEESKINEASPSVSIKSKKAKKLKTHKDFPSISSEFKWPNWLPQGWITIERVRQGGKTAGMKDKYYIEPSTCKRFRSQVEVRHHLGLLDDHPKPNEKNNSPKEKLTKADPLQYSHGDLGNLAINEMINEDSYTELEAMQDDQFERDMQTIISQNQMMYPNGLKSCQKDGASSSSSLRPDEAPMEEPKDVVK